MTKTNVSKFSSKQLECLKKNNVKYGDNDLRSTIYEQIDDNYGYGRYASLDLIIMIKNGYANASKMCNDHGKKYQHWAKIENSQELIDYIAKDIDEDVTIAVIGDNSLIKGVYVHPELVAIIAMWCDTRYARLSYKIVMSSHINEAIELKAKIAELTRTIERLQNRGRPIFE